MDKGVTQYSADFYVTLTRKLHKDSLFTVADEQGIFLDQFITDPIIHLSNNKEKVLILILERKKAHPGELISELNRVQEGYSNNYIMIFSIELSSDHRHIYLFQIKPFAVGEVSGMYNNLSHAIEECRRRIESFVNLVNIRGTHFDKQIEFSPEHKQAGLQILNYFQETLNQKYPDNDVTVRISQKGNTVTMEIETPDGEKEKYEEALEEYGLVVTGAKPVEEYLPNTADQMELKHQLQMANMQVEHKRDMIEIKNQVINSLEEDKADFKKQILQLTHANIQLSERMADLAAASHTREDSVELVRLLDTFFTVHGAEDLTTELDGIKEDNQPLFTWIGNKIGEVGDKAAISAASKELLEYLQGYF